MTDLCRTRPVTPYTDHGILSIDGQSLHNVAFSILDLSELFSTTPFRGENPLIESIAGRPAHPIVNDQLEASLPMAFSGAQDPTGTPYTDPQEGLYRNRQILYELALAPLRSGTATLPATLTLPGPEVVAFDIQPLELFGWVLLPGALARTVLRVIVPTNADIEAIAAPYAFTS